MRTKYFLPLLLAVVIISCSPLKKYNSLPEVTAWENDIQKFEQLDKTESYPENSILFTGSSSIRLWSDMASDMAPYNVIQRGYGGAKLSDYIVYADRIISPHPCSAIVIFIANDIYGGEKDKSPEEVAMLFKYLLKIIRKTHKDTPVFWIGITPVPSHWTAWPKVKEANSKIEDICKKQENVYFIRTDFAFLDQSGEPDKAFFVSDMLHLNRKGYKLWTELIKKELNKVVPCPPVKIIAHRGASFLAPENTVSSAKLAWELKADAVECDIYLSADQKIIVSHDSDTKRTCGQSMIIKNSNSADLRKLDAGSFKDEKYKGEKIPFLEELIETVPSGKELVIEVKCGPEVIPFLQKIISKTGNGKKISFISFDFNTISHTKEAFPVNPCYWLCSDTALLRKNIGLVKGAGLEGVSLSSGIISQAVAGKVKDLKMELYTWTVDDPTDARRLVSLGVKGITTNKPDLIRKELY